MRFWLSVLSIFALSLEGRSVHASKGFPPPRLDGPAPRVAKTRTACSPRSRSRSLAQPRALVSKTARSLVLGLGRPLSRAEASLVLGPFRMRAGFEGPRYRQMLAILDALSPAQRMKLISLSIGNANSSNSEQSLLQQVFGEKKHPTGNWATQAGELATGESAHHTAVPGSLVSARLPDHPRVSLRLVLKGAKRDNLQRVTSLAGASLVRIEVLDAPTSTKDASPHSGRVSRPHDEPNDAIDGEQAVVHQDGVHRVVERANRAGRSALMHRAR